MEIDKSPALELLRAIREMSLEKARLALAAGADPNGHPEALNTPLESAILNRAWLLAEALLDAGADPNGREDARGNRGLPLVCVVDADPTGRSLAARLFAARLLIEGCSPDAVIASRGVAAWEAFRETFSGLFPRKATGNAAKSFDVRQAARAAAQRAGGPVLFVESVSVCRAWPSGMFDRYSAVKGEWIPERFAIREAWQ